MKKIIAVLMTTLVVFGLHAQTPAYDKAYYLKKSTDQQKAGIFLLATGTTIFLSGLIVVQTTQETANFGFPDEGGYFLMLGGAALDAISIPLLMSSANNAREAAMLSLGNQTIPGRYGSSGTQFHPSIKLTFTIGR